MDILQIEIHRLELRYSHIRIKSTARIRSLVQSIADHGQLQPLLVVAAADDRLILIDGYQRLAALRQLGRDTAKVTRLAAGEEQAILQLLVRRGDRPLEAIEVAGFIQELHRRFNQSLGEIGRRIGRDKSWVKRHLDLLEALPEEVLREVQAGTVSTWAAGRILAPLARANPEAAAKLAAKLDKEPLTTRQLQTFYDHYRQANRPTRDKMIESPGIFLKSLEADKEKKEDGPEAGWQQGVRAVCGILRRLKKTVVQVFSPDEEKELLDQTAQMAGLLKELQKILTELSGHDRPEQRRVDQGAGQERIEPAEDCGTPQNLPEHRTAGPRQPGYSTSTEKRVALRRPSADHQGPPPAMPR